MRCGVRRTITACQNTSIRRRALHNTKRCLAEPVGDIRAAAPIRFSSDSNQFSRSRPQAQLINDDTSSSFSRRGGPRNGRKDDETSENRQLLRRIRIVPASASYFTSQPKHTDDILVLSDLLRKYQLLPVAPSEEVQNTKWKTRKDYQIEIQEPVRAKSYNAVVSLLKRLNRIHPSLIPADVTETLERFKRLVQPHLNRPNPIVVDQHGIAKAVGRRKSSSAAVFLVEGEGKCLINNKSLSEYFGRLHDRESAIWALKATQRLDKYNVWALVNGGGTTGQAEALTLGLAKALMAHEPALKPALRRGESHTLTFWHLAGLTSSQLAWLREIQGRSRERSPVSSRLARCPLGSNGRAVVQKHVSYVLHYIYSLSRIVQPARSPAYFGLVLLLSSRNTSLR